MMKKRNYFSPSAAIEVRSGAAESRELDFVISTGDKDRHNTVLNQDNWQLDNYKMNPIVCYQHNDTGLFGRPDPNMIIGKSTRIGIENREGRKVLVSRVKFEPKELNPLAEKIFRKCLFGSISAASVGFSEIGTGRYGANDEGRGQPNETYYFAGQELIEWSIVGIGSNSQATKIGRELSPESVKYACRALDTTPEKIRGLSSAEILSRIEQKPEIPPRKLTLEEQEAFRRSALNRLNIITMKQKTTFIDLLRKIGEMTYEPTSFACNQEGQRQVEEAGLAIMLDRNSAYLPQTRAEVTTSQMGIAENPLYSGLSHEQNFALFAAGATFFNDVKADAQLPLLSGLKANFIDVYNPNSDSNSLEGISVSAKRITAHLECSSALLRFGGAKASAYLENAIKEAILAALEEAILGVSARSEYRPQGMGYAVSSGQSTALPKQSSTNLPGLAIMQSILGDGMISNGRYGWIVTPWVYKSLLNEPQDRRVTPLPPTPGGPIGLYYGWPLFVSGNASKVVGSDGDGHFMAFGPWSRLAVVQFGPYMITVDNVTKARYGKTILVIHAWFDCRGIMGGFATSADDSTQDSDYNGFRVIGYNIVD